MCVFVCKCVYVCVCVCVCVNNKIIYTLFWVQAKQKNLKSYYIGKHLLQTTTTKFCGVSYCDNYIVIRQIALNKCRHYKFYFQKSNGNLQLIQNNENIWVSKQLRHMFLHVTFTCFLTCENDEIKLKDELSATACKVFWRQSCLMCWFEPCRVCL